MANSHSASTRKRGPQPSNLSVRLFLLDPENKITKVTKQTCSKESIQKLKQKGYGPPPPEHCTSDDKVEFPIALTNEQFKEKLVKIYPNLENSCFVLMKADKNNQLEELNPGTCCFRCYTPENVYHSERGQGRLYIQKIAESEISKCTHGVSLSKRLCSVPGYNQQPFIPIQPKQSSPAVPTFTGVFTSTNLNIIQSVALPGNNVLSAISRPVILVPASALPTQGLSSTTLNHMSGNTMPQEQTATVNSTVNMAAHSSLSSTVVSQTTSSPQVQNSVHVRQENPLLPSSVLSPTENSPQFDEMLRTPPWPPTPRTPNPISTENTVTLDQTSAPSVSMTSQNLLPLTNIVSQAESNPICPSAVNMVTQESPFQTPPNVTPPAVQYPVNRASQNLSSPLTHLVARNTATPQLTSFVDMVTQNQQQAPTTSVSQTVSRSGAENIYRQPQSQLPTVFSGSTASVCSGVNSQFPCIPTSIAVNASTPAFQGMLNMPIQSPYIKLPYSSIGAVARQGQFPRNVSPRLPELPRSSERINAVLDQSSSSIPFTNNIEQDLTQMGASFELRRQRPIDRSSNTSMLQAARTGFRTPNAIIGMRDPVMVSSSSMTSLSNPSACFSYGCVQSPGLATLADAAIDTEQREQREEYVTSDANIPNVQEIQELATQNDLSIGSFLENVESTGKLVMSLACLGNDDLMEKLNASAINIRTVEIESTCKLQQALTNFFLPSFLTALSIKDNKLNFEDIFALIRSLGRVNELQEFDLSGTTFTDSSSSCFLSVLVSCRNLKKLCLTDNSLSNQEINCLVPAFESMKNLVHLKLSKNNLNETQARDILQKQEGKSMVSLDLSQNAIGGNEITVQICHLQSLEHLDLSHNEIRLFPLPKLAKERDLLPTNIKTISLSSNHMTPEDVGSFSTLLIKSDLLKLNLDYNNVGNSIWSLCPLRIRHLKVLGLASAAICGPAVRGLAFLLSLTEELEELNLSSNNLMLADFQQLCSPLSKLTQLKRLNLSENRDGISVVLHKILPSLKNLEELRLSNVHLNGDDCIKFCKSLAFLKGLKYLDLSKNAIGPNGTKALASALMEFQLLEGLDMSKSRIKEDEISILCKGLVHLNRLKYLNLSGNRIDVEVMRDTVFLPLMIKELILSDVIYGEKLFSSITPLQHLRILHLSEMRLRPCDVEALTAMLPSFPLLEHLVLSNVVCAECDEIFSATKSLKNIKKIDLTGIQIRGGNVFAEMLLSLLSLEELVLANINVVDSEYNAIFNAIKSLRKLRKLDLTGTKIPDVNAFAEMLSSLLPLKELVLANIHINLDVKSQKRIFTEIKFLKSLRRLNLGSNMGITNRDSIKACLDMLSSLRFLEDLVFPSICLYGDETTEFFSAITSLKNLKSLDLVNISVNKCITKNLACTLPSLQPLEKLRFTPCDDSDCQNDEFFRALVNHRYLQELHLEVTLISRKCVEALTEVLPSLHSLEKLSLRIAGFYDECQRQLFAAIRNLGWLKELTLFVRWGTKHVTGPLAEALPSLQLLEKLTFRGQFDDSEDENLFVAALRSLKYLKELYLDIGLENEKTLAEVLPSLKLLENLVLKGGVVVKQVPAALGSLKYLKKLKLGRCGTAEDTAESLAEVLPSLQFLESLVFKSICFPNGSEKQVFVALRSLKYLKKLKLSRCYTAEDTAESLAEVLPSLQFLESLVFKSIYFPNGSEKQVFVALRSLKYLKKFQLTFCDIAQDSAETLAEELSSLQLLEELTLTKLDFSNSDQQLFTAVRSLSYLKKLVLCFTEISRAGATNLTDVLPTLRNLTFIYFPVIQHDENGEFRKRLEEAARRIPGLDFECW